MKSYELVDVPRRHCTSCGGRIWSLTTMRVPARTDAGSWDDRCNDCTDDPTRRDRWELFTTGGRR